jgi:ornithine cyclodeaminase
MPTPFYDGAQVEALLDYPGCIAAMRQAMTTLSTSETTQPLRQILPLGEERMFGLMPGTLAVAGWFGAKLVSVFPDARQPGASRHRGVVVLYEAAGGAVSCIADAEAITLIRTACATAAATGALARPDATLLAVFGTGAQAKTHIRAISLVRPLETVLLWGRSPERTRARAEALSGQLGVEVVAVTDGREAAQCADIICTVTSSATPVLHGDWVQPGAHVNLVGSSRLGPTEADVALVARSRFLADYRPGVLAQGAELAVAKAAGVVGDSHVVGEIGQVFAGALPGRQSADQVTVYKSLGHVVQDLAAAAYVHARALQQKV